jgi:hypothetical protein
MHTTVILTHTNAHNSDNNEKASCHSMFSFLVLILTGGALSVGDNKLPIFSKDLSTNL